MEFVEELFRFKGRFFIVRFGFVCRMEFGVVGFALFILFVLMVYIGIFDGFLLFLVLVVLFLEGEVVVLFFCF